MARSNEAGCPTVDPDSGAAPLAAGVRDPLADTDAVLAAFDAHERPRRPALKLHAKRHVLHSSDHWHLITAHGVLDVLTLLADLGSFADLRARAVEVPLGQLSVPIAHRDDLLEMKRAAGRPQDLADVRLLESLDEMP